MIVSSSWIVEDGWSRPLGFPKPAVEPRIEMAPSSRGVSDGHDRQPIRDGGTICIDCHDKPRAPRRGRCWSCTKRWWQSNRRAA